MTITGYGEDALCYWALSNRLPNIVRASHESAVVLFRPSFGRRGSSPEKKSPQFGEFDAIIGTPAEVYLVEAKWCGSSEIRGGTIDLREEQTRRHKIFGAYLNAWWSQEGEEDWSSFCARSHGKLTVGEEEYPIPEAGSKLAGNLKAVLDKLGKTRKQVVNLLLYLALEGERDVPKGKPDGFELVTIMTASKDGFVELPVMAT